jgi:hypothetical protein
MVPQLLIALDYEGAELVDRSKMFIIFFILLVGSWLFSGFIREWVGSEQNAMLSTLFLAGIILYILLTRTSAGRITGIDD